MKPDSIEYDIYVVPEGCDEWQYHSSYAARPLATRTARELGLLWPEWRVMIYQRRMHAIYASGVRDFGRRNNVDTVDFLRTKARMCGGHHDCAECPADGNCVTGINANSSNQQIEKVVAIVEQWTTEHPQETRLSKLLRQYPKAKAECIKEYYSCPAYLGYSCPSPKVRCRDCWDVPVEE